MTWLLHLNGFTSNHNFEQCGQTKCSLPTAALNMSIRRDGKSSNATVFYMRFTGKDCPDVRRNHDGKLGQVDPHIPIPQYYIMLHGELKCAI